MWLPPPPTPSWVSSCQQTFVRLWRACLTQNAGLQIPGPGGTVLQGEPEKCQKASPPRLPCAP